MFSRILGADVGQWCQQRPRLQLRVNVSDDLKWSRKVTCNLCNCVKRHIARCVRSEMRTLLFKILLNWRRKVGHHTEWKSGHLLMNFTRICGHFTGRSPAVDQQEYQNLYWSIAPFWFCFSFVSCYRVPGQFQWSSRWGSHLLPC